MEDVKWFKHTPWAIAILILVVFLWYLTLLTIDVSRRWGRVTLSPNVHQFGFDGEGNPVVKGKWRYGNPHSVPGESVLIVALYSVWHPGKPSDYYESLRNLLFVDGDLKSRSWLLPDNNREIAGWQLLRQQAADWTEQGPALATLLEVYEDDAESLQEAEPRSAVTIYLARPDGSELSQLFGGVTRVIGSELVDATHVVIFYVKNDTGHAAKIALADFSVTATTTLDLQG